MAKKIEDLIEQFKKDHLDLYEYCRPINLTLPGYDPKYTVKIGKRIEKNLISIFETKEGIESFTKLLDEDSIVVSAMAAKDLFPMYPDRCLAILEKFEEYAYDKVAVNTLINGLKNKEDFFMSRLEKLYGENWQELTRDNENENG